MLVGGLSLIFGLSRLDVVHLVVSTAAELRFSEGGEHLEEATNQPGGDQQPIQEPVQQVEQIQQNGNQTWPKPPEKRAASALPVGIAQASASNNVSETLVQSVFTDLNSSIRSGFTRLPFLGGEGAEPNRFDDFRPTSPVFEDGLRPTSSIRCRSAQDLNDSDETTLASG